MSKFSSKILSVILTAISFNATTSQTHSVNQLQKVVDKDLRKQYYISCKQEKLRNCHMLAFEQSIKLKIK